jgi:PAS domain S-box-containing protein
MLKLRGPLAVKPAVRYAIAPVVVLAAYFLRYVLIQGLGVPTPLFITLYPAIVLVAVVAGLWPGLTATTLCVLGVTYLDHLILPNVNGPHGSFNVVALSLFAVMSVLICLLAESYRRSLQTIARYEEQRALWLVNAQLELALASMSDAVLISDAKGELVHTNEAFATFHKFKSKADCDRAPAALKEILEIYSPNGELASTDMWPVFRALRGETGADIEMRLRRKDTGESWLASFNCAPLRDDSGVIIGSVVVARDVTESKRAEASLRRLNRVYAVLSAINETLVRQNDSRAMLQTACRIAVEKGNFLLAWAGMFNEETGFLEPIVSAGLVNGYLDQVRIDLCDPASGNGPAARAFHSGKHVVCSDIEHAFYRPWKKFATGLGFRSIASFPLTIDGWVKGVFSLYASEIGFFDDEELRLLDEMAMDVSFALEVNQLEERRREAEEDRLARERQLSVMYENIHDMLMYFSVEAEDTYRFVSVNSAFLRITGLKHEQVVGKLLNEVIPEPSRSIMLEKHREAIREGRAVSWTDTPDFLSGQAHIDASVIPVVDEQGVCAHLVGVVHDITEHMQTEQDLRRRTALFQAQVDSSMDGVLVVDAEGKKILHNRRFAEIWKIPQRILEDPDDAVQQQYVGALVKDPEQFYERIEYLNSHPEEVGSAETELADGRCLERYTTPVRDKAGNYYGRTWVFRDITERRKTEQDLRRRTALFEAQVDSSTDGVLVVDAEGKKILHNQRFAEMWKIPQRILEDPDDTVQQQYVGALVKDPKRFHATVDYLYSHPEEIGIDEIELADGRYFEEYTFPIRDTAGNYYGRTWTFRDITARRKAEQDLRRRTALFEAQVESSLDGVLVLDAGGRMILHNRRYVDLWRLPQELAENPHDSAHRQHIDNQVKDPAQFKAKIDYLNSHPEEISRDEIEMVDGRCLERYTAPVRDDAGNYYGRTWIFRDITERRKAEQDLRRRTAFFEAQVDSSLDGVLVVDANGKDILHNQRFVDLWRLPQKLAENPDDHLQRQYVGNQVKDTEQFQAKVDYLYSHPEEISSDEIELADGRCFDRYTAPVRGKAGSYYGRTWIFHDITERRKASKRIEQQNRVYRLLSDTNQTIMREKDTSSMLEAVCRIAVEKGGFRMAWLGIIDPAAQTIEPLCTYGHVDGYLEHFKIDMRCAAQDQGPAARCAHTGEHAVCDDIAGDPKFAYWRSAALARRYHSVACFPLKREGKTCGVLSLYSGEAEFFTAEELALIDEMAMNISFALEVSFHERERKQLEAETVAHVRELQVLGEMNKALLAVNSEKELLQEYCRIAVESAGYQMAWVGFAEQTPEKRVVPVAWAGHEDGFLSAVKFMWDGGDLSQSAVGRAVFSGEIQVSKDDTAPGAVPFLAEAKKRGYGAAVAIPFETGPASTACLTLYSAVSLLWTETERHLMQQAASALGYGIRTLRGTIAKEQYLNDLRDALEHSIQLISETVERRDPYTAGHQRRVAELCVHIAREIGLDEQRTRGLRLAATIHDLGKIGIPAEILSKPSRLSAAEFALIKEHSQIGYEILKDVSFPWPIAEMVLQHHERLNGSGYPRGLVGDAILIEARILTVADTVEALTTHRPYRPSLGIDFALKEILNGRGTLFDPTVVDACTKIILQGDHALME